MIRGLLAGTVLGGLVSALMLAVVSLVLPPPPGLVRTPVAEPAPAPVPEQVPAPEPTPQPEPEPAAAPEPAEGAAPPPAAAPVPEAGIVEVPAGSAFGQGRDDRAPEPPPPADPGPEIGAAGAVAAPAADAAPQLPEVEPAAPPAVAPEPALRSEPAAPAPAPRAPAAEVPVAAPAAIAAPAPPAVPAAPPAAPAPPAAAPGPEPAPPAPGPQLAPAPAAPAAPDSDTPPPAAVPGASPAPAPLPRVLPQIDAAADAEAAPLAAPDPGQAPAVADLAPSLPVMPEAPQPGFAEAEGVRLNRLPQLGAEPATPVADPAALPPDSALARYRAAFEAPADRLLIGLLLLDPETGGLPAAGLAALDLPATVALDPRRPDAAERMAALRAAGREVAILAAGLPDGATPADLEVNFAAWARRLPEAALVAETPAVPLQNSRALATQLVALAGAGGYGLVTHDAGLNTADQLAEAAGLPRAESYRVLDATTETEAAIRRTLDRAAFEAARTGRVLVAATASAETLDAIAGWLATRERDLAPAPASAVLTLP